MSIVKNQDLIIEGDIYVLGADKSASPTKVIDADGTVYTAISATNLSASGNTTLGDASTDTVTNVGTLATGQNATDRVTVKGIYMSPANVSVTIPSFAADTCDSVAVDVSGAFSMQPAVGDAVIAMPTEALPSNCVVTNAYVTATDTITVTFASAEGGAVTGAAKTFKFLVIDVT